MTDVKLTATQRNALINLVDPHGQVKVKVAANTWKALEAKGLIQWNTTGWLPTAAGLAAVAPSAAKTDTTTPRSAILASMAAPATDVVPYIPRQGIQKPIGPHPLRQVVLDGIVWADGYSDRSRQTTIGPSELGNACMRRLAYSLSGAPASNRTADPWFAIIGTAMHTWLEINLAWYQVEVLKRGHNDPRWVFEQVVETGDPLCPYGHSDLYDLDLDAVVDWKLVGPTTLKKAREKGPEEYYRVQAHTYGKAWKRRGRDVKEVIIFFLPRNAPLADTYVWSEPFDESVADRALSRLHTIDTIRRTIPLSKIPTSNGCTWCPFYRPHQPADHEGCPGHER